jgi:hypothetical protein
MNKVINYIVKDCPNQKLPRLIWHHLMNTLKGYRKLNLFLHLKTEIYQTVGKNTLSHTPHVSPGASRIKPASPHCVP